MLVDDVYNQCMFLYFSGERLMDSNWEDKFPVIMFADGVAAWVISDTFRSACSLNMFKFPFDTQECSLYFGNLIHWDVHVNISTGQFETSVNMDFFQQSNEFW